MADSRSRRSQACWIGVAPQGAHVQPRKGCSIKPLSSRKTMLACRRRPFFYPRPVALAPTANRALVAFSGTLLRSLIRPTELVQDVTHVVGMVRYAKVLLNHVHDTSARPLLRSITCRQWPTFQELHELLLLCGRQLRRGTGMALRIEPFPSRSFQSVVPTLYRRRGGMHDPCNLAYSSAFEQELPGNVSTYGQFACASCRSHALKIAQVFL